MVSRYIGSKRPREAGHSVTTKQDFNAHVSGGDWYHLASQIHVAWGWTNVQQELDSIISSIAILDYVVINPGGTVPDINEKYAIPVFTDPPSNLTVQLQQSPTRLDGWGDIFLPDNTDWNEIRTTATNRAAAGQSLRIIGQDNGSGPGGELWLAAGFGIPFGQYSNISLLAQNMFFEDGIIEPYISQRNSSGDATDLHLAAQGSSNIGGIPGNLWLESGVNGSGGSGSINLYSWPSPINAISNELIFDSGIGNIAIYQGVDTGNGSGFYISAQTSSSGSGGTLYLSSGSGTVNPGNISLNTHNAGFIDISSSMLTFNSVIYNPTITQSAKDGIESSTLIIRAQNNISGIPGNLLIGSGFSFGLEKSGSITLWSDDGGVILRGNEVAFDPYAIGGSQYPNPIIHQKDGDLSVAHDFIIAAQSVQDPEIYPDVQYPNGIPGNLWLNAGYNYHTQTSGKIYLYSDTSSTVLLSDILEFGSKPYNGVSYAATITQQPFTTGSFGSNAQTMTIASQNNTSGKGGDLMLRSGLGYLDYPPSVAGDSGNIGIMAGLGSVTISGSSLGDDFGGINMYGTLFLADATSAYAPNGIPSGGVFLYALNNKLYVRDTLGNDHEIQFV